VIQVNLTLLLVGLAKVVFGLIVGVLGVLLGSRALGRLMHGGHADAAVRNGNMALGVLNAAGIVSLGILAQHAVTSTFSAMDLLYRGHDPDAGALGRFAVYAFVHVGVSLGVGSTVLSLGAWVFGKLTREIDEIEEIKKGNVAAAIVLGGVLLVLALTTAPGLQTSLDGLLPLPALDFGEAVTP
jgi:uncharacterized membrane protein YjfL (UPF0719 family)